MGASPIRGNCSTHSVDIQWIKIMSCENCETKFSILKRRKTCCGCRYDFCTSCVSRIKGLEKKHQCGRCRVFAVIPCDRRSIMDLKIRHLRWFLSSNGIPMNGCKEKTELVDLVMEHLRYKESVAQYPQNFERHTVAPEYVNCDSPVGSNSSPVGSLNSNSHTAGPSSSIGANAGVESVIDNIYPGELDQSIAITYSHVNLPVNEDPSSDEIQIVSETHNVPTHDIEIRQIDNSQESPKIQPKETERTKLTVHELESMEHIDTLTVMQLKLILARNFMNYKGCCEKRELQERVRDLWAQKQKMKDTDSIPDENVCRICMEAAIDSVLLECGHVVTCTECGKRLNECPICRQYIIRVVHIFRV